MTKRRLSVSIDAHLADAAEAAVKRGEAPTLSAYVSAGLELQLAQDKRLRALAAALADFEAKHGKITEEEVEQSIRDMQSRAIHVRPKRRSTSRSPRALSQSYDAKGQSARSSSLAAEPRARR